jgi:hypothetical protein
MKDNRLIRIITALFALAAALAIAVPVSAATRDAVVRIGGCSGVCVDPAGIVLTAKHCGLTANETVVFPETGSVTARRIYVGPEAEDVVVFDCAGDGWPYVTVADAVPPAGSRVQTLGYPGSVAGQRNPGRGLMMAEGTLLGGGEQTVLQNGQPLGNFLANRTDLVTGPGWSGGPLFDKQDHVIGILSAGDEKSTLFISWAATRRAFDSAVTLQLPQNKPSLLIFGYENCDPCRRLKRDMAAGRFSRYDVEYVDVETTVGRERYRELVRVLEKATNERQPEGFPAFHLSGRASLHVGYPERTGLRRLGEWARETLHLPVTLIDAVTGGGDPGIAPPPPEPGGEKPPTVIVEPTPPANKEDDAPAEPTERPPWEGGAAGALLALAELWLRRKGKA